MHTCRAEQNLRCTKTKHVNLNNMLIIHTRLLTHESSLLSIILELSPFKQKISNRKLSHAQTSQCSMQTAFHIPMYILKEQI